jgi:hypothetical protein
LVIESPRVRVAVGSDTLEVLAPTLFAYFGMDSGDGEPSSMVMDASLEFQESLRAAEPGLKDIGVRMTPVGSIPLPLGLSPEQERAAGPPLVAGGMGLLLVDPKGKVRRLDRSVQGPAIVCAASELFERQLPPVWGRYCG